MLRLGSSFTGFTIEASDGKVGTVSDMLFDDTNWSVRWLVADTGGWLTGRKILIHPSAIETIDTAGRAVPVRLTRAQVEASPGIDIDQPVSRQMESRLAGYYGYDPLWGDGFLAGGLVNIVPPPSLAVMPGAPVAVAEEAGGDPHLRSLAEVSGYAIHAVDGDIGHLDDILLDDATWAMRYLVVTTSNWWIGKSVLLAPAAIREINWAERFLRLDLTRYKIKGSPPWNPGGLTDWAYEQVLRAYYGWSAKDVHVAPPAPSDKQQPARVA